jgi:protein gp37
MNATNISWTDYTSNPIRARNKETGKTGHYCQRISAGCLNCYASEWNEKRYGTGLEFIVPNLEKVDMFLAEGELAEWRKPKYVGEKVFVCDMTDMFGEWVPDEWIDHIWAAMALAPGVTFQLLTKRPERMFRYLSAPERREDVAAAAFDMCLDDAEAGKDLILDGPDGHVGLKVWPLPNIWLGTSVAEQKDAEAFLYWLVQCPAAVRFVSYEPAVAGVDFEDWMDLCDHESCSGTGSPDVWRCDGCGLVRREVEVDADEPHQAWVMDATTSRRREYPVRYEVLQPGRRNLDWVIVGGESGTRRRELDIAWVEQTVRQCREAGVAVWVKQDGARFPETWGRIPEDLRIRQFPEVRA